MVGRIDFPNHSLTLIVKGTFNLWPEKKTTLSEEQLYPTGDEFYPEDEEMQNGARYSSDFAYYKPRADLLLVGKCHALEGKKVSASNVTFQVGAKSKTLNVFGNRNWKRGLLGSIPTNPEPFEEMELRYENSFGGKGYKENPVGKGFEKIVTKSGKNVRMLPNIVNPEDQIVSPSGRHEPAGVGPLGLMWTQRFSKLGTYKGNYLKERWPWFAKNFDWEYFNAAPPDMQVEGYLRGDEELYFENLHPVHPKYYSRLPGLRVRCFLNETDIANKGSTNFREVHMNMDTLWVDMEDEKLVLVWRGATNIKSEDYEEIEHIFIVSEKLEEPSESVDYYQDLFLKQLAEEDAEESYEVGPMEIEEAGNTSEVDEEIAKAEEQMRASLLKAGINPDNLPEPTPEQKADEAKILKELGIEEEVEEPPLTRVIVQERIAQGEGFTGEDLSGLNLSGIDMKGVDFQGAILSKVSFKDTNLSGAKLLEANLTEADLSGANLKDAILKDADLTGANLKGADLTGAKLEDAVFEKANLDNAILDQVTATDTNFSEASLAEASLKKSIFKGADFSRCTMDKADFQGSNLAEATVDSAVGVEVNMSETDLTELRASGGCNFTQGIFRKATGLESIWEKANLKDADFSFSHMEGADFTSASLENANLSCSNMKFTRFMKANLSGARMKAMNLFQGSLEKANLTGADLRGSNLYGAEFLDSIVEKTKFELANLKMTKLSKITK